MADDAGKKKYRLILDWSVVILVVAVTLVIYINRERIQELQALGYVGVFLLCMLSNVAVFLPAPSLLVVVAMSQILHPFPVAVLGALGSSAGELSGYALGAVGNGVAPKISKFAEKIASKVRNPMLYIFILAALPLPCFDLAGTYAGVQGIKVLSFWFACFLGKLTKMLFYVYFFNATAEMLKEVLNETMQVV